MNLLPKSSKEFGQKDYWDSFFKKRGNQAFEWYGEYPELCNQLHKYIKPKDHVLVVGCGNSVLGNDLYDVGYKNITSIDISNVAIRQMNNLNEKRRPEMKFLQMDATNMSFPDNSFTAIIDKGTLDALMPDNLEDTLQTINKYFSEMIRVLKIGGRYICISLLQEQILNILVNYFPSHNCMFRIVRCFEAEKNAADAGESPMPVFVIICTKFLSLPSKILELSLAGNDKMQRIAQEEDLIKQISSAQQAAFVCSGLKNSNISDDNISFDMFLPNDDKPRYTVFVTDIPPNRKNMQYAAFIVPQGRETEWMFSTIDGRKELASMSKCNRLAVVIMHRNQVYESLDAVKVELEDCVRNLAPATIGTDKILFLSLGADVGERILRFEGTSKFSGNYVVEDVTIDDDKFRRLFYLSSQSVIQSEAKLKRSKSRSGNEKETIDVTYLNCEHHIYISRAVAMSIKDKSAGKCLIIGLGGGGLCSFLRKYLQQLDITAVDIDADMLKIAVDWFDLSLGDKMHVEIKDGIQYLAENGTKYDNIVFDVDSKDQTIGMSCPPKEFLEDKVISDVVRSLTSNGLFIVNIVLRDNKLRPGVVKSLQKHFKLVVSYKLEHDLNEIFLCFNYDVAIEKIREQFSASGKEINQFFKKHKNIQLINNIIGDSLILSH